jgi:hypothetical protein
MSNFGRTAFGGSPFIRRTVGPAIVVFLAAMPLLVPQWNVKTAVMIGGFYALGIPMVLGLFIPGWGRVSFRIVAALVFVLYLGYAVSELMEHDWKLKRPRSRGEANPVNALLGLLVIGGPCLMYAVLGRFTWKKDEEESLEGGEGDDDDDSEQQGGGYSPAAARPSNPHSERWPSKNYLRTNLRVID